MGHALDNTMQDILIRFKRMQGYNALWQPGTDHASIATEVKIIEKLKEEGIDKHDLGREKFLERANRHRSIAEHGLWPGCRESQIFTRLCAIVIQHGVLRKYAGMERYETRKAIVDELDSMGLLVKVEDYSHNVGTHDRCRALV